MILTKTRLWSYWEDGQRKEVIISGAENLTRSAGRLLFGASEHPISGAEVVSMALLADTVIAFQPRAAGGDRSLHAVANHLGRLAC